MPPSESRFRFTVLAHDSPFEHWDLLLEPTDPGHVSGDVSDECLLAWRLLRFPETSAPCEAQRLPNHRRRYLDFEGPVSGNRGEVRQIETAWFAPIRLDEAEGMLELELFESRFGNRMSLTRRGGSQWVCRIFNAADDPDGRLDR